MYIRKQKKLTKWAKMFLEPTNTTHRQYEALRAFFVDGLTGKEVANRFGYTEGSFRVLVHQFRQNPQKDFFLPPEKGPHKAPKTDKVRELIISMRKQNLSVYDISKVLKSKSHELSPVSVSKILKEEGFAKLPRRKDDERPHTIGPMVADVADVRNLDLSSQRFRTKFGGLFLFLPFIASIAFDDILQQAGFPGSKMIPAGCAIRSLLALKLFGSARHSHVMSYVLDPGLAMFAGLNVVPKRSFLTEYSCRIDPGSYPKLMQLWFDAIQSIGIDRGNSFDLDFHTIPFHGEDALVEKHYVSKRSRKQKGILAFLAQDADTRVFCYANSDIRKDEQNDEILRFIEFWKDRTGQYPQELIFDSKLTTYNNLNTLNKLGIGFMTLRRRSKRMVQQIHQQPLSAWRRIELQGVSRVYKTPRILDQKIPLRDYQGTIRQLVITDLGHDEPIFLLTNQLKRSAAKLIQRYAKRMIIENRIEDSIDFFHMDALSSAVAMKVNLDVQLSLMASSLYRLFALKISNGYERAKSRHIFRDFIDATANVRITKKDIVVNFQKRAHNPLLIAANFEKTVTPIPWLENRKLHIILG
jgi:transposase